MAGIVAVKVVYRAAGDIYLAGIVAVKPVYVTTRDIYLAGVVIVKVYYRAAANIYSALVISLQGIGIVYPSTNQPVYCGVYRVPDSPPRYCQFRS